MVRVGIPLVLSTVVVVLAADAVAKIGPESGPYQRAVDGGYAALTLPLVESSNSSASSMSSFLAEASALDRATFFSDLDVLASDTASALRRFDAITPPEPAVAASGCRDAMADRARATAMLRDAFEGVVGGHTGLAPVHQAAAATSAGAAGRTLLSGDASWASCRRQMRAAPGHARLASSVWIHHPATVDAGALAHLLGAVAATRALIPVHRLTIVAVVTDPLAVPSGQTRVVPPTRRLVAHVVIANEGNVEENGVEVGGVASVQDEPASPVPVQRTVTVAAGASSTLTLPSFVVVPGSTYVVQVTAEAPRDGGSGVIASRSLTVQVQPATTLIAVSSPVTEAASGRSVSLVAVLTPGKAAPGAPSGTVAFQDDGTTIPACAVQPIRGDKASCTTTLTAGATHAIGATYGGDARLLGLDLSRHQHHRRRALRPHPAPPGRGSPRPASPAPSAAPGTAPRPARWVMVTDPPRSP